MLRYLSFVLVLMVSSPLALAIPHIGQSGTDSSYESSDWVVCRADQQTAWVSADSGGEYDAVAVCQQLGYGGVDAWGGTCGSVCGYCGEQGNEHFDGAGGNSPDYLSRTVHWRCSEGHSDQVPEFSMFGAGLLMLAVAAVVAFRRR